MNLTVSTPPFACRGISERIQTSSSSQIEESRPLASGRFKSRCIERLCILFLHSALLLGQSRSHPEGPLAHTFSIVARDPATGEMGVAVQSHWFSVGSAVSWAEAGAGAIATQSFVNVSFGPKGLELLKQGKTAGEVVRLLIEADEGRDFRQLAVVDSRGNVAVHTGKKCIRDAGHKTGGQFACQANMMLNNKVWRAMARVYERADGPLAERLIAALEAGQEAGGDIRGRQSSAILIVKPQTSDRPWEDRLMDLRVEDHPEPVRELKRLVRIHRAYAHMNAGDLAVEKNDMPSALAEYRSAEVFFPDNLEMKYWHAVSLANTGLLDQAMPLFRGIFAADENYRLLTRRLPDSGLLNISRKDLKKVLNIR
ncbi:DUF1028 domain-containing protein [bacterium]|nr:DUF1028 domain-containing protein [bacterium]